MAESPDLDYAAQVREYLAYCSDARGQVEAHGFRVDPRHHPSAEGAVKMIPHGSDRARAEAIRQTYAELTPEAAGPGAGTSQTEAELEASP
jgi:hypothetical protein